MRLDFLQRIYKLKVTIVALVSLGLGIALLVLSRHVPDTPALDWLALWPIGEIGGTLAAAGLFGIAWDYVDGKDKEAREDERIRRLLKESVPAFRDAVVEGLPSTAMTSNESLPLGSSTASPPMSWLSVVSHRTTTL